MYFGLVKRVEEEEIEKEGLYKIYLIYSLSDCTRQELFNGKGRGGNKCGPCNRNCYGIYIIVNVARGK